MELASQRAKVTRAPRELDWSMRSKRGNRFERSMSSFQVSKHPTLSLIGAKSMGKKRKAPSKANPAGSGRQRPAQTASREGQGRADPVAVKFILSM